MTQKLAPSIIRRSLEVTAACLSNMAISGCCLTVSQLQCVIFSCGSFSCVAREEMARENELVAIMLKII